MLLPAGFFVYNFCMGNKVAIIVGHERSKPGALLKSEDIEITEYNYNSDVASIMKKEAPNFGLNLQVFFRDGVGRIKVRDNAIAYEPDIILELHFDSASIKSANGCSVLSLKNFNNHPFINDFFSLCLKLFGGKIRGIINPTITENGFANVKSPIPLFLLEPFFGSNENQAALALKHKEDYALGLLEILEGLHGFET